MEIFRFRRTVNSKNVYDFKKLVTVGDGIVGSTFLLFRTVVAVSLIFYRVYYIYSNLFDVLYVLNKL